MLSRGAPASARGARGARGAPGWPAPCEKRLNDERKEGDEARARERVSSVQALDWHFLPRLSFSAFEFPSRTAGRRADSPSVSETARAWRRASKRATVRVSPCDRAAFGGLAVALCGECVVAHSAALLARRGGAVRARADRSRRRSSRRWIRLRQTWRRRRGEEESVEETRQEWRQRRRGGGRAIA